MEACFRQGIKTLIMTFYLTIQSFFFPHNSQVTINSNVISQFEKNFPRNYDTFLFFEFWAVNSESRENY